MTTKIIEIDATNGAHVVVIPVSNSITVSYNKPLGGTATAGAISIKASVPSTNVFNDITGISDIVLATPEPQTISGVTSGPPADRLELTLAGFTGTASKLSLSIFYRVD